MSTLNKLLISSVFSLALSFNVPIVQAQTGPAGGVRDEIRDTRQNVREEIRDTRQNVRDEIRDTRQGVRDEIKQGREVLKEARQAQAENFKAKKEEFNKLKKEKREEFKAMVDKKKEDLKDRMETKRKDLKDKLKVIKDEKKKQIVEKIDQRLDERNEKTLNHFSNVLEKLEEILGRISSRTDKAEANGKDVSSVRTLITEAESAIAASRSAIAAQSGRTYPITFTGVSTTSTSTPETNLRADVGKARQALHNDLVKVRETVFAAREAVKKAAVALAQIPRVNELEIEDSSTSTPASATSTNQ